jgi:hypothetical protein
MRKHLIILFPIIFLIGCTPAKFVTKKIILPITLKSPNLWTLEDCNKIIDYYTVSNFASNLFNNSPMRQDVFIRAMPFNNNTVTALAKKEIIEKRLPEADFVPILKNYLEVYTNFTYNSALNKIVEQDSNYSRGYSFKIFLENTTDPFEPIFLEDGYSYFFLENMIESFSRVIEVTGLYAEDYIQLDGYLNVIITFSPFSADGRRLFNNKDLNESYRLVFNGLQKEPISIQWNLN